MKDFDYRYMVYNTKTKEFQFMRICETTIKGAEKCLKNLIGTDAFKWRFEIRRVSKEEAEKIRNAEKLKRKIKNIQFYLNNFTSLEIEELIHENNRRQLNGK